MAKQARTPTMLCICCGLNNMVEKARVSMKRVRESYEDFVIENGVLIEYRGDGGVVHIPDTVKTVGKGAFNGRNIKVAVYLVSGKNVEHIDMWAFYECESLVSVRFPRARVIGIEAFYKCKSLKEIDMPLVENVAESAFEGCTSLVDLNINRDAELGDNSFKDTPIEEEIQDVFGTDYYSF